jgi:hypothetical protein
MRGTKGLRGLEQKGSGKAPLAFEKRARAVPKCNILDESAPGDVITLIHLVLRYTVGTLNGGGTNAGRRQVSERVRVRLS